VKISEELITGIISRSHAVLPSRESENFEKLKREDVWVNKNNTRDSLSKPHSTKKKNLFEKIF